MDEQMKIKTALAEPGMTIAKDIYTPAGHLILSSGTKLTDRMITRLKFYSVDQLVIVTPAYLRTGKTQVVQEKPVHTARSCVYLNKNAKIPLAIWMNIPYNS